MGVVTMKIKEQFFNAKDVQRALSKAERKALTKTGALLRRQSRKKLKRRKGPAPVGQPPHVHSRRKAANLRNILFGYEKERRRVIVGPVRLPGTRESVPAVHEGGGTVRRGGQVIALDPRPTMQPTLREESDEFAKFWENSVR